MRRLNRDVFSVSDIPLMRVSVQPIKLTGSWMYVTGSWKEATVYKADIGTIDKYLSKINRIHLFLCITKEFGIRIYHWLLNR